MVLTCSPERRDRERVAAVVALAETFAREAELVERFEAKVENPDRRDQPTLTREVDEVLTARDWALARFQEWSP